VNTEMVTRADLSRFFRKSREEIDRMVVEDALPAVTLPGPSQDGKRFFLPDVHRWLMRRTPDESGLRKYEVFRQAVEGSQPVKAPGKPRKVRETAVQA
jgi:hypothetical protein